jgi:myosin heavy subunit
MVHDYPLERTLESCALLMRDISNARHELETNAETLHEMMHDHKVLEETKKRLAELTKHERSMSKRNAALTETSRVEENTVKNLSSQLASLAKQTEMTEMYLNMLDREIEDALRHEEAEERARVQQDLIKQKMKNKKQNKDRRALSASDGDTACEPTHESSEEDAEAEQPWSREEEVEYLQLQTAQELLRGELKQLSLHVDEQKSELRTMLDTLDEGETAVLNKRSECEKLEEEAERWREELERLLRGVAAPSQP